MAQVTKSPGPLIIGENGSFSLPPEAVTETFAIVGKRGRGKTYTASVLAEEMLARGFRIVALDPMGIWWGLRLQSDGKTPAHDAYIFGGEHGDLSFGPNDGETLAQAIVEADVSAIVDLSLLRKDHRLRFIIDFAHTLFQINRTPRHLFLEEADDYCHERPFLPDSRAARSAIEDLVKRGRTRGLGITMITQRPAAIAKDVLTQAEVFIAHGVTAPQDRKAVDDWIKANAEPEQREEFLSSLAELEKGEVWIWSPDWLQTFARIRIKQRRTYDASATPTFDAARKVSLPGLDLRRLQQLLAKPQPEMSPTPAKGKAAVDCGHDKQIADLRAQISEAHRANAELAERELEWMEKEQGWKTTRKALQAQLDGVGSLREGLMTLLGPLGAPGGVLQGGAVDHEAIVQEVLARLPTAGSSSILQITSPEALRKRYLQSTVDRLMARIGSLSPDARTLIELLLGQDRFWNINRAALALTGNDSGGTRTRWSKAMQELAAASLVIKGGSGRSEYKANIQGCVETELAPHGPSDEEVSSVVNNVLYRLSTDGHGEIIGKREGRV